MSTIMKVANKVTDLAGGRNLAEYFGDKMAKKKLSKEQQSYLPKAPSGKEALKSAGKVGLTIAGLAGTGAMGAIASKGMAAPKAASALNPISASVGTVGKIMAKKKSLLKDSLTKPVKAGEKLLKNKKPLDYKALSNASAKMGPFVK